MSWDAEKRRIYRRKRYAADRVRLRAQEKGYRLADPEKYLARSRARYAANLEKERERGRKKYAVTAEKTRICAAAYREVNRKKLRVRSVAWRRSHPEKCKMWNAAYTRAHPEKHCANVARREALKLQAVPAWADAALMNDMYAEAAYQGMELDHMVPLNSLKVCGLHWEGNFQLLTPRENRQKGNRSWPDMWPRIDTPLCV